MRARAETPSTDCAARRVLVLPDDARDHALQRQVGGPGLAARRHDLDAATLVVSAADVPFALEVGEVLVHGGERAKRESLRDLFEARRVPLRADLGRDEIQDFALTAC